MGAYCSFAGGRPPSQRTSPATFDARAATVHASQCLLHYTVFSVTCVSTIWSGGMDNRRYQILVHPGWRDVLALPVLPTTAAAVRSVSIGDQKDGISSTDSAANVKAKNKRVKSSLSGESLSTGHLHHPLFGLIMISPLHFSISHVNNPACFAQVSELHFLRSRAPSL